MKTLSGVDGAFLHLETPETPMHVGSLSLFELPAGYKGNFFADVKKEIRKRIGRSTDRADAVVMAFWTRQIMAPSGRTRE